MSKYPNGCGPALRVKQSAFVVMPFLIDVAPLESHWNTAFSGANRANWCG